MTIKPAIRVLGPTTVDLGERSRLVRGLPERALWILTATTPTKLSSEEIADALWDDRLPPTWQSALRTHLTTVRRMIDALEVDLRLAHDRDGYWIDGNLNLLDIYQFRELVTASRSAKEAAEQVELLGRARVLWVDPPYARSEHPVLRSISDRTLGLFEELERQRHLLAVEGGNAQAVVNELQNEVLTDPSDLTLVEPLVAALLALGDTDRAAELLARHRAALENLGLEPGLSVSALERRLLSMRMRSSRFSKSMFRAPRILSGRGQFVGRSSALAQFWSDFESSSVSYVLIHAGPGLGKSHLVAEIARSAIEREVPVLAAAAEENASPLQLVRDLVQPWNRFVDGLGIESFENLLGSVVDSTPKERAIVVLEDVHFADLATAKLLRRLVRREPVDGLVVVITTRDGSKSSAVEGLLGELERSDQARRVSLAPFSLDEVFEFVRSRKSLSTSATWTLAGQLHRRSGGVPLTLDFLIESDADSSELATSVTAAIRASADRLDAQSSEIICVSALMSEAPHAAVVADVCSVSLASVYDAFDKAFEIGLVERRVGSVLRFRHQLVRQALSGLRSNSWRCENHRLLSERLRLSNGDTFAVIHQAALAIAGDTSSVGFDHVYEGVRSLQLENRWEESLVVLEALDQTLSDPPRWLEPEYIFEYLLLKALAADGSADSNLARHYFRKAIELGEAHHRQDWRLRIAIASSGSSQPLDGDPERVSWLRAALDVEYRVDQRMRIEALSEFVYVRGLLSVDDEVQGASDELGRLAAAVNDDWAHAYAAHGQLVTLLASPAVHDRIQRSEVATAFCHAVPPEVATTPLLVLMHSHLQLGDYDKAVLQLFAIEELANRRQRPGDRWVILLLRSLLEEWVGNEEAADRYCELARSLAERHEVHGGLEAWSVFRIARALKNRDDETLESFAQLGDNSQFSNALRSLVLARAGNTRAAAPLAKDVLESLAREPPHLTWLGTCMLASAGAAIIGGSTASNAERLLLPHSGLISINGLVPICTFGPVDREIANLLRAQGRSDEAALLEARWAVRLQRSQLAGWRSTSAEIASTV